MIPCLKESKDQDPQRCIVYLDDEQLKRYILSFRGGKASGRVLHWRRWNNLCPGYLMLIISGRASTRLLKVSVSCGSRVKP